MQSTLDPLQSELDQEADATLRVLQRVPLERFERGPHPRSVSLGELALQIARIPAGFSRIVGPNEIDIPRLTLVACSRQLTPTSRVSFAEALRSHAGGWRP